VCKNLNFATLPESVALFVIGIIALQIKGKINEIKKTIKLEFCTDLETENDTTKDNKAKKEIVKKSLGNIFLKKILAWSFFKFLKTIGAVKAD